MNKCMWRMDKDRVSHHQSYENGSSFRHKSCDDRNPRWVFPPLWFLFKSHNKRPFSSQKLCM